MALPCAEGEGYPEFTLVLLTCSDAAPRGLVQGPPSTRSESRQQKTQSRGGGRGSV